MTRLFFLIVSILLFISKINLGQSYIGLDAGVQITPYLKEQHSKYYRDKLNYSPSFSIAAIFEHKHSKRFSTGIHLNYNLYNFNYNSSWYNPFGGYGDLELNCKMGYFGVYFFPQLNFGKRFIVFINAGPYIGILSNSHATGIKVYKPSVSDPTITEDYDGKLSQAINSFIAIQSSIGFQYKINKHWMIKADVSFRYEPCLIDSHKYQKQLDITFNVGFLFMIKEKQWNARQNEKLK